MATAAELALIIRARDQFSTQLKKAQKQISTFDKSLSKVSRSFNFGQLAGAAGIGGVAVAVVKAGVAFNLLEENAQLAFTQMIATAKPVVGAIGDIGETFSAADRAATLLSRIKEMKTPFNASELISGAQRLLAFGFQAEKIPDLMRDITDTVAAMGGSSEVVERVTMALGQMQTKGKVSAEEMMQLAEAGIPAWQLLADNIGDISPRMAEAVASGRMTQQQVIAQLQKMAQAGKLPADKALAALQAGMRSRFGGMSEKVRKETTGGAFGALIDQFDKLAAELNKPAFKSAGEFLRNTADAVEKMRVEFNKLPDDQKNLIGWVATIVEVGVAAGAAAAAISLMTGSFSFLGGALAVARTGLAALLGPIGLVAAAVAALLIAWENDFLGMRTALQPVMDKLNEIGTWLELPPKPGIIDIAIALVKVGAQGLWSLIEGILPTMPELSVEATLAWAGDLARRMGSWLSGSSPSLSRNLLANLFWAGILGLKLGSWFSGDTEPTRNVNTGLTWSGLLARVLGSWFSGDTEPTRNVNTGLTWSGLLARVLGSWFAGETEPTRNVNTEVSWAGRIADTVGGWIGGWDTVSRDVGTNLSWLGNLATAIGAWLTGEQELSAEVKTQLGWAGTLALQIGGWLTGEMGISGTVGTGLMWIGTLAERIGDWLTGDAGKAGTVDTSLSWTGQLAQVLGSWLAEDTPLARRITAWFDWARGISEPFRAWLAGEQSLGRTLSLTVDLIKNLLPQWLQNILDSGQPPAGSNDQSTPPGGMGPRGPGQLPAGYSRTDNQGRDARAVGLDPDWFAWDGGGWSRYRARGGGVGAGLGYIVGERGPELFTPGSTGRVTSSADLMAALAGGGSGTVINRYAFAFNGPVMANDLEDVIIAALDRANRRGRTS